MEERRTEPRNYIDRMKKAMYDSDFSIDGLRRLKEVLKLEDKADQLLSKINERI